MEVIYTQKVTCGAHYMQISNDDYKVTQIEKDLWAIEDIKSSEHTICYLVIGTDSSLLFDTGLGISPVSPIIQELTKFPITVVLSHWHFDHCGAAHEFQNILGWQSEAFQDISQNGASETAIKKIVGQKFFESIESNTYVVKPFPQIKLMDNEQTLKIGNFSFQVIYTPGHTADSICLYKPNQKWLFTGDTIYSGHNVPRVSADILEEIDKLLADNSYVTASYPKLSLND